MKTYLSGLLASAALLAASPAPAATYEYIVDSYLQGNHITGSIDTNLINSGISAANIVAYNISINGTIHITPANGYLAVSGYGLGAGPTLTLEGVRDWYPTSLDIMDMITSTRVEWAYTGGAVMSFSLCRVSGCVTDTSGDLVTNQYGTLTIGTNPDYALPLPSALPLFASGLGLLGLLRWRSKRKV